MVKRIIEKVKTIESTATGAVTKVKENWFVKEFREFALKGSIVDLAIGIMIGGGFNKIVSSLVDDVIMPPIGLVLKNVDFSNLFINLSDKEYPSVAAAKAAGAPTLNYGIFINNVINFTIIAVIAFLIVRQINRMRKKGDVPPSQKECSYCFSMIPIKAVRCPQCTSELPETQTA
jgi:large conductance mechanosensitive channel